MIHNIFILVKKIIQKLINMVEMHDDTDRGVRTSDKLTYRIILQNKVNAALDALGTDKLEPSVISLRTGMLFDMPGVPFRTKINKNKKKLKFEKAVKIRMIQRLHPGDWKHAGKRLIHELTLDEEFYTDELEFLIDLLATHDALMQPKGYVESGDEDE